MANFPAALDFITMPGAGDNLNTTAVLHHLQHDSANSAISAIEVKLGIDNSTVVTTVDYLLKSAASIDPGHHHTTASVNSFGVSGLVTGGYKMAVITMSGNFTANYTQDLIRTSGALTAVLPGASGLGKFYYFKNISGTVEISASGANTIDGGVTALLDTQYQSIILCDAAGGNWDIL